MRKIRLALGLPVEGAEAGTSCIDRSRLGGSLLLRVDGVRGATRARRKWIVRLHPRSSIAAPRGRVSAVLRSGRGATVLAQQSTQHHHYLTITPAERGIAGRRPKLEAAMGPSQVVVLDVLLQDAPEVALVHD